MCMTDGTNDACTCGTTDHAYEQRAGGLPVRAIHAHDHGGQAQREHVVGHDHRAHAATIPVTASYGVEGMTCSHCVASVSSELSRLDGVSDVSVELNAGGVSTVTVSSASELDRGAVAAALDEAGYELVGAPR